MSNVDVPTGWALIAFAVVLWLVFRDRKPADPTPPLTREPDLFDEQAALYGPARMYGRLEPIDDADPFADFTREEFDRLTSDPWAWRLFEEIQDCTGIEEAS